MLDEVRALIASAAPDAVEERKWRKPSNPDGVPMCSGYFELRNTDAPLDYYYAYDEMKVVLEGEFLLENKETGQKLVAKAKDAIFFPKGSKIYFSTPDYALAFYAGQRDSTLL